MTAEQTRGTLPQIIRNYESLYQGDLIGYFRIVFNQARNLRYPYHNFRHMLHVTWLCYQACLFYRVDLDSRRMRNLLIAALFHDFDHSGMLGDDDLNIARAVRGLERYICPDDTGSLGDITTIIRATEYPYLVSSEKLGLLERIIRDCDLSQAFSVAWIQQVVIGLSQEWCRKPIEILESQTPFLRSIKFSTEWAQAFFPQETIEGKIKEVQELLELLNGTH